MRTELALITQYNNTIYKGKECDLRLGATKSMISFQKQSFKNLTVELISGISVYLQF